MNEKTKNAVIKTLKILIALFCLGLSYVRIINLITLIVGIIYIWRFKGRFEQFLGWVLVFGSVAMTIVFSVLYSKPGGMIY
ncbi:MAG: hypothetical protein GF364_04825 [Candidatus Lokiarchaeota archaeon]|nr:hypothetical protein [Candidatus Lokiarchaeota archaeon]